MFRGIEYDIEFFFCLICTFVCLSNTAFIAFVGFPAKSLQGEKVFQNKIPEYFFAFQPRILSTKQLKNGHACTC